jgi:hypothetical protein
VVRVVVVSEVHVASVFIVGPETSATQPTSTRYDDPGVNSASRVNNVEILKCFTFHLVAFRYSNGYFMDGRGSILDGGFFFSLFQCPDRLWGQYSVSGFFPGAKTLSA